MSSELSLTLSIPQLLQFRVCLGLTDGPPSLHLDTSQPSLSPPSSDYSGVDIKIETHIVNGQRTLRVFAVEKPGQQQPATVPSPPPATTTFPDYNVYSSQAIVSEHPAAPSPQLAPQTLPGSYDFPIQDAFMNGMNSMPYSNSENFSLALGSTDNLLFQDFMQSELDQRIISIPSFDTQREQTGHGIKAPPPSEATTPAVSRPATPTSATVDQSACEEPTGTRKRPRRFSCLDPSCPRRFASKYTLNLHMTTHQQSGPRVRYPCEMGCAETFSRQHDRLRHEVSKHGRVCEWLCNRCRHVFSSQGTRDKHRCAEINVSPPDLDLSGS